MLIAVEEKSTRQQVYLHGSVGEPAGSFAQFDRSHVYRLQRGIARSGHRTMAPSPMDSRSSSDPGGQSLPVTLSDDRECSQQDRSIKALPMV